MVVGTKHQHLLAVLDRLEGRPQRHLGLAITHVAAEQTVHRALRLHVVLDRVDSAQLVRGLLVGEGLLEAHLPLVVLGEAEALGGLPESVEMQQFAGHLAGRFAHPALDVFPGLAPELRERRRRTARPHVAHDLADLVVGDVEHVPVFVGQVEVVAGDAGHRLGGDAFEAAHPVVLVDHEVALAQVAEAGERDSRRGTPGSRGLVPAREDLGVGEQSQLDIGDEEVTPERRRQERHPRSGLHLSPVDQRPGGAAQDESRPLCFRALLEGDHHPVAVVHQAAHGLLGLGQVGHRQLAAPGPERGDLVEGLRLGGRHPQGVEA